MATKLTDVTVQEVSLVKRGANGKKWVLTKSADAAEIQMEDTKVADEIAKAANEALEKAAADLKAATDKVAELEKAAADNAVATATAKAESEKIAKEAVEKAEALEKALAESKEAKEIGEAITKAAADFKNLPEKAEALGPDLRAIRKSDAALCDRLESLLRKCDALVAKALDPVGTASADDKSETAWDEITKRANAMVVAKVAPTFAVAVTKVLADDTNLYAAHTAETRAPRQ